MLSWHAAVHVCGLPLTALVGKRLFMQHRALLKTVTHALQGCTATICMPVNTPEIKVANVRKLGGVVQLVGESYQETQAHAVQRSIAEGLTFIPPYDDPHTISGQGTIGDEILRQASAH
jgi:threonine dehydratase